jgi:hypothetical protein
MKMGCVAREPLHCLAAQPRETAIFEGEPFLRPRGILPIGNSQERKTMVFHIGTNLEGELCARSEARCVRVWRRSDLLRDGTTEEQLEGMGYCPLRKRFPGCSIKGDKQFEDTLYTTTIDKLI